MKERDTAKGHGGVRSSMKWHQMMIDVENEDNGNGFAVYRVW